MINLLEETEQAFIHYNKTWDDVAWIGGRDFYISIEQFKEAAKNTRYDSGYGCEEVAVDLIICFHGGAWLSRAEYDGSEWWRYNAYPKKPQTKFEGSIKLADPHGYDAPCGLKGLNQ